MYSCAAFTCNCFLVILHLTIRMTTTTVHTNISSTSVDGITVLMMIMVDSSDCSSVGVVDTVTESMVSGFSIVCVARLIDEKVSGNPEKLKCVHK